MTANEQRWTGIEAVKVDVRNLMLAQEAFRRKHGRYTGDLPELLAAFDQPDSLFRHPVELRGDDRGFTATVCNDALKPGPSRCSVFVGTAVRPSGVKANHLITE